LASGFLVFERIAYAQVLLFIANIPWSSLMSGSFTTRRWLGVRSILVLGIGILMLAVAVAQKPVDPVADEVMCLYFDERSRTDSDYLVVGLLEGTIGSSKSKEGHVINMFPPGNDGSKMSKKGDPEDYKTIFSFEFQELTLLHFGIAPWFPPAEEGQIADLFPPRRTGAKNNDPVPGIDIIPECDCGEFGCRYCDQPDDGTGYVILPAVQMARDSARRSSGVNNIKNIALGVRNYESDDGRYPRGRPASSGDLKNDFARIQRASGDVIECEHCGASCTEPCRCNPTGLELIFGNTDDELVDMHIESDYVHLLFVTCYGIRSVTLYPREADSNQTLVVAKGWREHEVVRIWSELNYAMTSPILPRPLILYAEEGAMRADESNDGTLDPSRDLSSKQQGAVDDVENSRPIEASADAPGIVVLDGGGNGCLQ